MKPLASSHSFSQPPGPFYKARVVKWQTRAFEGRMPQGVGVQVPPRALSYEHSRSNIPESIRTRIGNYRLLEIL